MSIPFANADYFVSGVAPPQQLEEPALWFVVQGSQVLVTTDAAVPQLHRVEELELTTLRSQFLGMLGNRPCYSVEVSSGVQAPLDTSWQGLRSLYGKLDDALFALAGRAVQIVDWDRSHQYCGRCGTATITRPNERARECPSCGYSSYPRIAPAVMALVKRERQLLLARSPHFPQGMYSALAGFVEPGESLEECLRREVKEESGVDVGAVRYFASQPWPFPHSLMIAFICDYAGGELQPDLTEIEDAGWFGLDNLPVLPGKISIARRLIDSVIEEIRAGA